MNKVDALRLRYDRGSDVLYVSTGQNGAAYGEEGEAPGLVWRYRDDDDALVGVTVMDFQTYWKPRYAELVDEFSTHFGMPQAHIENALEAAKL
jgi:hypothetical protein